MLRGEPGPAHQGAGARPAQEVGQAQRLLWAEGEARALGELDREAAGVEAEGERAEVAAQGGGRAGRAGDGRCYGHGGGVSFGC